MSTGLKVTLFAIGVIGVAFAGNMIYNKVVKPKGKGVVTSATKNNKVIIVKKK